MSDPFRTAAAAFGLTVKLMPGGAGSSRCSCDGACFADRREIVVAHTPHSRRPGFTCLHELAHYLIRSDADLWSYTYEIDPGNRGLLFEDRICDAFAAAILVPEELVDGIVPDRAVTAQRFVDLYKRSGGSREACAVRLSQRLRCEGYMMLTRLDGEAVFTAGTSDSYHVARGVAQGDDHISVLAGRLGRARHESFVRFASGKKKPFFADALVHGSAVFVVLAAGPQWPVDGPTVLAAAKDRPEPLEFECEHCEASYETFDKPCRLCRQPKCRECSRCSCSRASAPTTCAACHLELPPSLFPPGSNVCRDCS